MQLATTVARKPTKVIEASLTVGGQLPLAIAMDDAATFDNFASVAAAGAALQSVRSLFDATESGCYLWGPTGVGKSHLLQAACHAHGHSALYFPLAELVDYPPDAVLQGCEASRLIAFDELDKVVGRPEWQVALFHAFNRQRDAGGNFLFAAHQSPAALSTLLPDLQSRLTSLPVFHIAAHDDHSLMELLRFRAARRGLDLSEEVLHYVIARAPRSSAQLLDLLDQLDSASLARARAITVPFINELKLLSQDR